MQSVTSFEEFLQNDEKVDAVIFNLEQIGETAKKLTNETKLVYDTVNWPSIIGLRNMISHEYEGIKIEIIYDIVHNSLSVLLTSLNEFDK
jgi:uncharacterized protein with HEPN domain